MKKNLSAAVFLLAASANAFAQTSAKDSLRVVNLQEVQVVSTRATSKTPVAYSNISQKEIQKQNFGLDLPFLLTATPSVLTTSDAGSGVGYTSIRVRGTDATRINITANGIPMNDAESHSIFWVNTPDLASSLEDMQIQRGAGTSTNGAGAFGASINLRTAGIPSKAYAEVSGSYGSFNTHKETVRVGSGLLGNHWAFDTRISNIQSDGYRDRATSDLKSYFLQGGYYGENTTLKLIAFGGKEKTYHAWDGISREQLETIQKQQTGIISSTKTLTHVIKSVKDQQNTFIFTEFNPAKTKYFILNNGSVALAGRVLSIDATENGSVIHISLVNLLSTPISNIGFNATWGVEKPVDAKEFARWQQLLFNTSMKSTLKLLPGQWQDINLTLKGVSPNNLGYLKLAINMENIQFDNLPSAENRQKRSKK